MSSNSGSAAFRSNKRAKIAAQVNTFGNEAGRQHDALLLHRQRDEGWWIRRCPAGHMVYREKWKQFTYDAQGSLVVVTEPDPKNVNNTLTTNYTYNGINQLTGVSMTRGTVTQTRSFQWTASDLTQSTNPENGTVTYQYDLAHHVTLRTDAKNQRTTYNYDSYGRVTQGHHYDANNVVQTGQDVTYNYDDPNHNAWGRQHILIEG